VAVSALLNSVGANRRPDAVAVRRVEHLAKVVAIHPPSARGALEKMVGFVSEQVPPKIAPTDGAGKFVSGTRTAPKTLSNADGRQQLAAIDVLRREIAERSDWPRDVRSLGSSASILIQPNLGFGDYARLSCRVGDTQLGRRPGSLIELAAHLRVGAARGRGRRK
jgi:hypothetical protein